MEISRLILKVTDSLKPLLVKIIPIEILSDVKKRFLNHNASQLKNVIIAPYQKEMFESGVNLIGNIKGDSGLGQSCRLLAFALENSDYPVNFIEHSSSKNLSMLDTTYDDKLVQDNKYSINIFHINAHEFALSYLQLGKEVWDKHYNIAYWLWELEDFPDVWVDCINLLDEIWTPAEFISESIRKKTTKPVITVPYHVTAPIDSKYDRKFFGLPEDKFLFLMMFDCGSMIERKNPKAVIEAYKKAFELQNPDVGLIIKINGGNEDDVKQIKELVSNYENIYFINQTFSKIAVNSLIKCSDVVVSLHRAEGFGLVLAEAMLNGVPCIATNWSANTEFMNADVACMVDYKLIELDKNVGPYEKGNRWADPDVGQAADFMRKLYEDKVFYGELSEKAKVYAENILSLECATTKINARIREIEL